MRLPYVGTKKVDSKRSIRQYVSINRNFVRSKMAKYDLIHNQGERLRENLHDPRQSEELTTQARLSVT